MSNCCQRGREPWVNSCACARSSTADKHPYNYSTKLRRFLLEIAIPATLRLVSISFGTEVHDVRADLEQAGNLAGA